MNKEKIIVILSGGLDSTTLTYYLHNKNYEVHCLSFDYGQKHKVELEKAKITCNKLKLNHKVIDMTFMKDLLGNSTALTSDNKEVPEMVEIIGEPQPITYVPFRNMLMSSLAFSYAEAIGASKIALGIQAVDEYSYWDTTPKFKKAMNDVAKQNRENQIQLIAPFVNMSKTDEILIGQELGINYSDTITCYNGTNCGTCPTCTDRIKHFAMAGIKDPIKYEKDIDWEDLINKYKKDYNLEEIKNKIE